MNPKTTLFNMRFEIHIMGIPGEKKDRNRSDK